MKKKLVEQVTAYFTEQFKNAPDHIFLSPGRINIIGEHVDYNDGFVLPAAINKYVCFAVSANADTKCTIIAKDLNEFYSFDLTDELKPVDLMWVNFFLGVLQQLKDRGFAMTGFNIAFSSTVPMGAGLSSSAAVECGFGYALNKIFSLGLSKQDIALIGQKSEHTFVGVNCGIMDQFASVFGKKNKVIKLDCNTLEYEYHNADFKEYALLLLDSKVKHTHLTSGYNDRRNEVEKGLAQLKQYYPEVNTFRDLSEAQVVAYKEELGDVIFRRCLFVVREIQRVLDAVAALQAKDFTKLGDLMFKTHDGLSKNYEVSCEEIDFLVDAVRNDENVIGSRMMGGGFGGCSINLVKKDAVNSLIERVSKEYKEKYNISLKAYKVKIAKGTTLYKA
ncbi:galactokinase [Flavobacterium subsaxonicum]|uniref:Galactokinase n=1 Tax=Flavobacterium subsaxonicum WB 4.1-42 = DSM 21790 TaxID=1121898 RepID=A0A0A2MII6_9FLAO|nr:galactokinase [Flavobacterium subsaxonicum]KGO91411.1 galactokinase [Flavobacterium subsaxonicum WB 4.1-42 = DSM 21790]